MDVKNVPGKIKNVKKRGKNKKRLKTFFYIYALYHIVTCDHTTPQSVQLLA